MAILLRQLSILLLLCVVMCRADVVCLRLPIDWHVYMKTGVTAEVCYDQPDGQILPSVKDSIRDVCDNILKEHAIFAVVAEYFELEQNDKYIKVKDGFSSILEWANLGDFVHNFFQAKVAWLKLDKGFSKNMDSTNWFPFRMELRFAHEDLNVRSLEFTLLYDSSHLFLGFLPITARRDLVAYVSSNILDSRFEVKVRLGVKMFKSSLSGLVMVSCEGIKLGLKAKFFDNTLDFKMKLFTEEGSDVIYTIDRKGKNIAGGALSQVLVNAKDRVISMLSYYVNYLVNAKDQVISMLSYYVNEIIKFAQLEKYI